MEKGTPQRTLQERFEARVVRGPDCWTWAGSHNNKGYPVIAAKNEQGKWRPYLVHRIAYELLIGPIPDGLKIDHLCCNTRCVNPGHLEPVTQQVNMLRGNHPSALAVRTGFCKRGHRYTAANTMHNTSGSRECRACRRMRDRQRLHPRGGRDKGRR